MTFTIDDLVASFSSNHIGQEAIDLATLQTQLSQTLAYSQQQQSTSAHGHCNTPTARTPTKSFANWSVLEQRRSRSSTSASTASRRGSFPNFDGVDMIMEESMDADDEYAVEQLVGYGPGQACSGTSSPVRHRDRCDTLYAQAQSQAYAYSQSQACFPYAGADPLSECTSPVASSFSASDPFFAAAEASNRQVQQASQNTFFAQTGRAAQHSSFYVAHTAQTTATPFAHSVDLVDA